MRPEYYDQLNLSELSDAQAQEVCAALREDLISSVSKTGGHLASNLGAVELTVALHRAYDLARDRLVFDVGHQCYCHKMLTGRAGMMDTLRKFNGIAGFPKPNESETDAFVAGHASNSVSVAIGMAKARTLLGEDYDVVALIGDGAFTGGLAYEGLSNAGQSGENIVVILNDNGMSIRKNVGGVAKLLARHHLRPQYLSFKEFYRNATSQVPGGKHIYQMSHKIKSAVKGSLLPSSMFEDMGFHYLGPVDGHDVAELTRILSWAKSLEGPVLVHVRTQKGKGFQPAEQAPHLFHGVSPFDTETGAPIKPASLDFSAVFGRKLTELAGKDRRVCAVTAAMESGTGLDDFDDQFPKRFLDVGIAEGHAVAMAAGMAKQGMLPVFAVYSTFLQRSYDMLHHDVALQRLHVVFGVDRAGLVGADGETHHGVFDVAYLSSVPYMTILSPASFAELEEMLEMALLEMDGPVAVRYPRGGENGYSGNHSREKVSVLCEGTDLTIVSYGVNIGDALAAADKLAQEGISAEVIKLNQLCPLVPEHVLDSVRKTGRLLMLEEVAQQGCVGERVCAALLLHQVNVQQVKMLNCGSTFVPHGSVEQLRALLGIDADSVVKAAQEMMK